MYSLTHDSTFRAYIDEAFAPCSLILLSPVCLRLFVFRSKQRQVFDRVSAITSRLGKKPDSVEAFVSLMSFLEEELGKQQELMVWRFLALRNSNRCLCFELNFEWAVK